jgi:DNA invertase Pin-like site-specific DNA recombinase
MGKLVFQLTGALAEFERAMIRQRIKAGLKRAVAQGVKLGRPKIDSTTERRVRKQLAKGHENPGALLRPFSVIVSCT